MAAAVAAAAVVVAAEAAINRHKPEKRKTAGSKDLRFFFLYDVSLRVRHVPTRHYKGNAVRRVVFLLI